MIIEICGIDGSGKTTLINTLRKQLNQRENCWTYERNFKSTFKVFLEDIALKSGLKHSTSLFNPEVIEFSTALELVKEVYSQMYFLTIDSKQIYFVDKYYTDWLVRASINDNEIYNQIRNIYDHLPFPTLSFYLEIPERIALERINSREKGDRILSFGNSLECLVDLNNRYKNIRKTLPYNQHKLDSTLSIEQLTKTVIEHIDTYLLNTN